jgi:hypothetical protein
MVAEARRADGSHLIDAGWTPDIEAQGSTDQAAVGYENFRSFISESPVSERFPNSCPARSPDWYSLMEFRKTFGEG